MANANEVTLKLLADSKDLLAKLQASIDSVTRFGKAVDTASQKKLTLDVESAIGQVGKLEAAVGRLEAKLSKKDALSIKVDTKALEKSMADAEKAVAKAEADVTKHLRKIEAEAKRNIFGGLSESAVKANQKLTAEFNKLSSTFDRAVANARKAQSAFDIDPSGRNAQRLRDAQVNVKALASEFVAFGQKAAQGATLPAASLEKLKGQIAGVKTEAEKLSLQQPIGPGFLSSITSATSAIRLFLGSMIVRPILDLANSSREAATEMDQLERRLSTLTGSLPKARQEFDALRETADKFGLNFEQLAKGFVSFAIASDSVGKSLDESRSIFNAVSIAAAGAGTSADNVAGIFTALTQIMSKGKVQAEELRGQLGDRLPGAFGIMAKALGVTTAELDKMLKTGEVLSGETLPKFAQALLASFGDKAIANIDSAAAQMARFDNAIFKAKTTIGAEMLPALNELLAALVEVGSDGESSVKKIGSAFKAVTENLTDFVNVLRDVGSGNLTALFNDLLSVIVKSVGAGVKALSGLVAGLGKAAASFPGIGDAARKAFNDFAAGASKAADDFDLFVRESSDGFKILASEARGGAKNIAEAYNEQTTEVRAAIDKLTKELVSQSEQATAKQIEDSKALTAAQKAEFAERKRDYEDYLDFLKSKSGAITEAEKTELAKRKKAYDELKKALIKQGEELSDAETKRLEKLRAKHQDFASDLVDLYQDAQSKIPALGPNTSNAPAGQASSLVNPDDARKLDELKQKLAELRAEKERLAAQPTFSVEDSNRLGEIGGEIATLESQLITLGSSFGQTGQTISQFQATQNAQMAAFSAQFLTSINKLVTGNQEFRDGFAKLPPAAQDAAARIIESYRTIASNGKAFSGDSILFLRDILNALNNTGAGSSDLAETMTAAFNRITNNVDPVKASLDSLKVPIDASKAAASAAIPIYDAAGKAIASIGGKADEAAGKITTASGKVIEIGQKKPPEEAKKGIEEIGTAAKDTEKKVGEASKPVADFGNVVGTASTKVDEAGTAADKLNTALATLPGYLQAIVDIAPALAPAMQTLATAFATNEGPVGNIVSLFLELDSHLLAIAENAPKVVTAVQGLAEAGKAEGTDGGISKLATAFAELLKSVGPVAADLDKAKIALEGILTAAKDSPKAVEDLNKAFKDFDVTEFVKDAESATKAISETNVELVKGKTATEGWATALGQVKTGLDGSLTALKDIKTAAGEFATIANETLVPALREMAREFGTIGIEAPKLGTLLEFIVKQGVQGIKDLTEEIKKLAITMREEAVPAANELATAMSNIKLP